MKFKSSIIFLITMLLFQSAWSQDRFHIFTALNVGAQRTSNLDVEDYIEATRLGPDVKMRLFKLAESDWEQYQKMLSDQFDAHYDEALKELAYAQLLEYQATKALDRDKKRRSFLTTEREYFDELQKRETEAVQKYLDQRLGIVEGRKRFGQDLIDQGYPHKVGESPEDVYWKWYENQKQIVRESFRKQEVLRHEYVEATRYNKELRVRPTDLFDLKKELDAIIDNQLHGKKLGRKKIQDILSSHPALKHRVSQLHVISMEEESLAKIKELDESEFEQSLAKIRRSIPQLRERSLLERLQKYEDVSATLAQKYNDTQKLEELSEQSLSKFVEGGTYNDFMMARLYSIASNLIKSDVERQKTQQQLISSLEQALPELLERLSSPETYTQEKYKSLLFENVVAEELKDILNSSELEGHIKQLTNMAIWVVKFEAKKMAREDQPKVLVQKSDFDTFEGQNKLNEYLKRQEYLNGLKDYHNKRLSRLSYLLELRTQDGRRLRGEQAYRSIVGQP